MCRLVVTPPGSHKWGVGKACHQCGGAVEPWHKSRAAAELQFKGFGKVAQRRCIDKLRRKD